VEPGKRERSVLTSRRPVGRRGCLPTKGKDCQDTCREVFSVDGYSGKEGVEKRADTLKCAFSSQDGKSGGERSARRPYDAGTKS